MPAGTPYARTALPTRLVDDADSLSLSQRMSQDIMRLGAEHRREQDAESLASITLPEPSITGATGYEGMLGYDDGGGGADGVAGSTPAGEFATSVTQSAEAPSAATPATPLMAMPEAPSLPSITPRRMAPEQGAAFELPGTEPAAPQSFTLPAGGGFASGAAGIPFSGGGAPAGSGEAPRPGDIEAYIRHAAASRGIDPDIAVRVARSEGGLDDPVRQSDVVYQGQREQSYGPLQLNVNGGVGSAALKAGIDPRNPAQWRQALDFGLDEVARAGWGQWHGAARVGIGEREGIGTYRGPPPPAPPATAQRAAEGRAQTGEVGAVRVVPAATPNSYWTAGGTHGGAPAADIFAPKGSPIYAPVSGTSVPAVYPAGGNATIIRGDDGRHYYMAHGNVPFTGGRIQAGQQIGQVGDSGNAKGTTPHLHYAIASNPSIFDQKNGSGDITGDAYWTTQAGDQGGSGALQGAMRPQPAPPSMPPDQRREHDALSLAAMSDPSTGAEDLRMAQAPGVVSDSPLGIPTPAGPPVRDDYRTQPVVQPYDPDQGAREALPGSVGAQPYLGPLSPNPEMVTPPPQPAPAQPSFAPEDYSSQTIAPSAPSTDVGEADVRGAARRPYWQPTDAEQAAFTTPVGPEWLPEPVRQGLGAVSAGSDYLDARANPTAPMLVRSGILVTDLTPEQQERHNELQRRTSPVSRRPGEAQLSAAEMAEYRGIQDAVEARYQAIKDDPDAYMGYYHAAPGSNVLPAFLGVAAAPAVGGVVGAGARGAASALGAGARTARGIGYAADIAAQTAFDPTTPFTQGPIDAVTQAVRAGRRVPGQVGAALADNAQLTAAADARMAAQGSTTAPGVFGISGIEPGRPEVQGMRPRIIPTDVADQLDYPISPPTDPSVLRAIEAAGGTVDERGTTLNVIRHQDPEAAGGAATRSMTFYTAGPPGSPSPYARSGTVGPTGVGGQQRIEGRTRFRNPLFISDAPGEARGFDDAMQQMRGSDRATIEATQREVDALYRRMLDSDNAYDAAVKAGRGAEAEAAHQPIADAYDAAKARLDAMLDVPRASWVEDEIAQAKRAGPAGSPARAQALKDLVTRYGGDPDVIDDLIELRGAEMGESVYAVKENIVAGTARRAGHDGVITIQQTGVPAYEVAQHPSVVAAKAAREEAVVARNQAIARGATGAERQAADDAYYAAQDALEAARDQVTRELAPHQITELADPRELRNPTPPTPTAELKAAYRRAKDAEARFKEVANTFYPGTPAERQAAEAAAAAAAQREVEETSAALERLMNETDTAGGYTLRPDIPRRGPGSEIAQASAGALQAGPRRDPLAGVNRALSQGVVSSVSGGVGAQVNQELNPDDPYAGIKGFAAGALVPPLAARGGRALARAAGRSADLGSAARIGLGDVPPSRVREPLLPGMEPPAPRPLAEALEGLIPAGGPEGTLRHPPTYDEATLRQFQERIRDPEKATAAATEYQRLLDDDAPPEQIASFLRSAEDSRWWDRFDTLRYASMLSDPVTHGQNALGSVQLGVVDLVERPLTAMLDAGRVAVTGGKRDAFMAETPAMALGMAGAARQGLSDAAFIMQHGLRPEDAAKLDRRTRGFGTNIPVIAPKGSGRADVADFLMEGPLRALSAADAFFRGMYRGGHLSAEATRAAMKANDGKAVTPSQVKKLIDDPEVARRADERAAQTVLQEDRDLTSAINSMRNRLPPLAQAGLSVVVPYLKTPYNIVAQGVGMTPAGVISVVKDIRAGKSAGDIERRVSRMMLGGGVMAWAGYENLQGLNTGAYPETEAERSTLPPGWRPFSRKVELGGETYYVPLALLGPAAIPAIVSILATEQVKQGDPFTPDKAAAIAEGIGSAAQDQTFLRSIADFNAALSKGGTTAQNYLERQVSQFSPHILGGGGVGRRIEAILGEPGRDPEGMAQSYLATFPYGDRLADALGIDPAEVRRDVLGRESVTNPSGLGALVPIRASVENDAPVIAAFRTAGEGLPRQAPDRLTDPQTHRQYALSPAQQERWQREFGQEVQTQWQRSGSSMNRAKLQEVKSAARAAVNERLIRDVRGGPAVPAGASR